MVDTEVAHVALCEVVAKRGHELAVPGAFHFDHEAQHVDVGCVGGEDIDAEISALADAMARAAHLHLAVYDDAAGREQVA